MSEGFLDKAKKRSPISLLVIYETMAPAKANTTLETIKRPKYREMVKAAILDLAEKKGSSRQAIMKYIVGNYSVVDDGRSKALVRAALVEGVKNGELAQTKGTGASGSFKIGKTAINTKAKEKVTNSTKETKKSQKKGSKDVKEMKTKTEQKGNTQSKGKGSKKSKKNESGEKATKKKPPNPLVAKAAKGKRGKASGSVGPHNSKDRSASPLTGVKKIKAKLLFTSTPSKKKNKISKLLTPKRVVVKTKQFVKKPKTEG